jgi:hypothetical protein
MKFLCNSISMHVPNCEHDVLVIITPVIGTTSVLNVLHQKKTTYLNPSRPAGSCVFHTISHFRLTTRCSECIVFIRRGIPVMAICSRFDVLAGVLLKNLKMKAL